MRKIIFVLSIYLFVFTFSCTNQEGTKSTDAKPVASKINAEITTRSDSVFYAIGLNISKTLKGQGFESDDISYAALTAGIHDGLIDSIPKLFTSQEAMRFINIYLSEQLQKLGAKNLDEANRIIDSVSLLKEYIKISDGLFYKNLKEGKGATPKLNSKVMIFYTGQTADGQVFENSYERNQPTQFEINSVIVGWQEVLLQMQEGDIWEVVIHPDKAYGPGGGYFGQIQPNKLLIYKIELVDIIE